MISLICVDGSRVEKEMRCVYQITGCEKAVGGFQMWGGRNPGGKKTYRRGITQPDRSGKGNT